MSLEADFAERLSALGTHVAFGVTGSGSSWKLITALEGFGGRYFPAGHEAAAAIMAGGAWRATGQPSLAVGIKGPGLANMLPGITFNHFENLPVISACEAYGPSAPSHRMHKRMDQASLLRAVCKGSISLSEARDRLPDLWEFANEEITGPVHVDLCDGKLEGVQYVRDRDADGDVAGWDDLRRQVAAARRPVLIVGSLALRREWGSELHGLRVPIFTTAAAKGAVDEAGPNALGVYTGDGKSAMPEASVFAEFDLVVGIGLRNIEVLSPKAFPVPFVMLDETGPKSSNGFNPSRFVRTANQARVRELIAMLGTKAWGADIVASARSRVEDAAPAGEWLPAACFRALNQLPGSYSIAVDTGSFCTIAEHYWHASKARKYFGSSNGRFMGGAVPTAIGAAAADSATPLFCVTGDGGIRMYFGEVALAVQNRLPICFILMSDGRYGSVAGAVRGIPMSNVAVDASRKSWLGPMEAMGCRAESANTPEQFLELARTWTRTDPLYIECRFAAAPYAVMTDAIR